MSSSSYSLVLTPVNGEPRIHDLLLAERLGFKDPREIRKLIKRHEEKLLSFGTRATVARVTVTGQPYEEFFLNRKQAMFICMKSETDNAFDVQTDIIHVYDAYLNGELKPVSSPQTHHALSPHLRREVQVDYTKSANKVLMERGGKEAIVSYAIKNCVVQSGQLPAEWKRQAKAENLPSRIRNSAKEVLRVKAPPVACGMSLADQCVAGGASVGDSISIGKESHALFAKMLACGVTPAELLL